MIYAVLSHFVRSFDGCSSSEQKIIHETLEAIKDYLEKGLASYGLRVKRLSPRIYEARINIRLRIAFFRDKNVVKFFCLGNHEDIARCLKRLRFMSM